MGNNVEIEVEGRDQTGTLWDRVSNRARTGLRTVGDAFKKAEADTTGLRKAIDDTTARLAKLTAEARKTGDRNTIVNLEKERSRLKGLQRLLDDAGAEGASRFSMSFSQRVGPLLAKAPLPAPLLAAAAGAAPALTSIVSAAIAAGAAAGAVGIGTAIVAQEPVVQAAAARFGEKVTAAIRADASPMVRPVLAGLAMLEQRADRLRPTFRDIFADAARYAPTLFNAAADSGVALIESFEEVVDNAEPVVDMLGVQIPNTARALGSALEAMTEDAGTAAEALSVGFTLLNATVTATAGTVKILNEILPFTSGALLYANQQLTGTDEAATGASFSLDEFLGGLGDTGSAAQQTAVKVRTLDEILNDLADSATTAWNAETKFAEVLDQATDAAYRNGAGVNANTEQGRRNRDMLGQMAEQTRRSTDALAGMAGGAARATQTMNAGYDAFVRAARGMGLSRQAAQDLARQLGLIPRSITTTHRIVTRYEVDGRNGGIHVSGPGGSGTQVKASGGPIGAAGGGARGGLVEVGEHGRELVRLPYGSQVIPNGQTERMLAGAPGGGRGSGTPTVVVQAGVIGSSMELRDWLTSALDDLRRRGRL